MITCVKLSKNEVDRALGNHIRGEYPDYSITVKSVEVSKDGTATIEFEGKKNYPSYKPDFGYPDR